MSKLKIYTATAKRYHKREEIEIKVTAASKREAMAKAEVEAKGWYGQGTTIVSIDNGAEYY